MSPCRAPWIKPSCPSSVLVCLRCLSHTLRLVRPQVTFKKSPQCPEEARVPRSATLNFSLREFACELTSSWPPALVEGRVWAALVGQNPANRVNLIHPLKPANPVSVPECAFWRNSPTFFAFLYEKRSSSTVRSPKCPSECPQNTQTQPKGQGDSK